MNAAKVIVSGVEMDLKKDLGFGLNYSIDDVRKPETKNSNYSKTITLVGTPTVNKLMGGVFDINADFSFFNPNKKTEAKIVVNSSTVMEGSLQLKSIDIINPSSVNIGAVEYKCVVVGRSINFMTDIKDKMLSDLDLSEYDHDYELVPIEQSWFNTSGYVYPLFKKSGSGSNVYNLEELKPAIFYKTYLEKIFLEAGYKVGGSLMDETTTEGQSLAKEIIPYSGKIPLIPTAEYTRRAFRAAPTSDSEFASDTITSAFQDVRYTGSAQSQNVSGELNIYNNDSTSGNFDNGGVWDVANSTYTIDVKGNYGVRFDVDTKFSFFTSGVEAFQSSFIPSNGGLYYQSLTPNNSPLSYSVNFRLTKNGVPFGASVSKTFSSPIGSGSGSAFNAGNGYSVDTTKLSTISFNSLNLLAGDVIGLTYQVGVFKGSNYNQYLSSYEANGNVNVNSVTRVPVEWKCEALAATSKVFNSPNSSALNQGDTIFMSSFIPANIKQTDLINDLVKRYNAYISVDEENDKKILLNTRDSYYEGGDVLDWTNLRDNGNKDTIKLLSELQNKEVLFTYKKGEDIYSNAYFNSTDQIYGQKTIAYDNDFVKGSKKIESFFRSVALVNNTDTLPAAIVSGWDVNPEANKGFSVMYYDGLIPTIEGRDWAISYTVGGVASGINYQQYPYAGHLDNPFTPNLDLNFGSTSYFGYTLRENDTDANLYNRFWSNYINQINEGKLVVRKYRLNEVIIDKIRKGLNVKIYDKDSYFYINKIIDYNPVEEGLTSVELLKIKDGIAFQGRKTDKPNNNGDDNGLGFTSDPQTSASGNTDNSQNSLIAGDGNNLGEGVEGAIVQGDNNTILDGVKGAFIIGANEKTISQDYEGWIGENRYINGVLVISDNSFTLLELLDKRDNSELKAGSEYFASDKGYYFTALKENVLNFEGRRLLLVVKSTLYSSSGIFDENNSYSINDLAVWGGKVWRCKTAGISTPLNFLNLAGSYWDVENDLSYYELKSFNIKYSEDLDTITEQSDDRGNIVFLSDGVNITGWDASNNDGFDYSDWNDKRVKNNVCSIFINNIASEISKNNCKGIVNNFINGDILDNRNNGNIAYNDSAAFTMNIVDNINNGDINYNISTSNVNISYNDNNGGIGISPNTLRLGDVLGTVVNL